jgi:CRP-like cAMP-binding protein
VARLTGPSEAPEIEMPTPQMEGGLGPRGGPDEDDDGEAAPPHIGRLAQMGRRMAVVTGTLGCLAGVVAILVVGGIVAGPVGLAIAGALLVVAVPAVAFARDQWTLTTKGREFAASVEDVEHLKGSDAAAFRQVFTLIFQAGDKGFDAEQRRRASRLPIEHRRAGTSLERSNPSTFWDSLAVVERQALIAVARERRFSAGAVLVRAGQQADHVILIQSGVTKVCVDRFGGERIVALRGPGELIGERAALRVSERSATVIALDNVQALVIDTADFRWFLGAHPRLLEVIEGQLYERLTEDRRPAVSHAPADIEEKLALLILDLLLRQGLRADSAATTTLPITARELARWAHAPQPSVERVLASWRKRGVARPAQGRLTVNNVEELRRICGQASHPSRAGEASPRWTGQNCSILLTDIAGFGARDRSDRDREIVRRAMYELLEYVCEGSGVPWGACHREDRGDGALVVVPPSTPTASVIDPLLLHLAAGLRRHNQRTGGPTRMQLRVALAVGPVVSDADGVTGHAIISAARLLDAPLLKQRLADTRADLGFIASEFVYLDVIKHAGGHVDPSAYERVRVRMKETKTTAWMYVTGGPPGDSTGPAGDSTGDSRASRLARGLRQGPKHIKRRTPARPKQTAWAGVRRLSRLIQSWS